MLVHASAVEVKENVVLNMLALPLPDLVECKKEGVRMFAGTI